MKASDVWVDLLRRVQWRRSPNARFFKPVCLIAAIDLTNELELDPYDVDAEAVCQRFYDYVKPFYADRAESGWQPLWYLSKEKLWSFTKDGAPLGKYPFRGKDVPGTKRILFRSFDKLRINKDFISAWKNPEQLRALRDQLLLILADDGEESSRKFVRPLYDPSVFDDPSEWPSESEMADHLRGLRDQFELFDEPSDTSAHEDLLAFDTKRLPKPATLGPKFRAKAAGPISLDPEFPKSTSQDQEDLHRGLVTKVERILADCPVGRNQTALLREAGSGLLQALGDWPRESRPRLVWTHGNSLRRLYDGDVKIRANPDPDDAPLSDALGERLADLVEQFNVYADGDTILATLDRRKIGPRGRAEVIRDLEHGRQVVRALQANPGVMDHDAVELMSLAASVAESALREEGIDADQGLATARDIERNGSLAIMKAALGEVRGWGKIMKEGALREVGAHATRSLIFVHFANAIRPHLQSLLNSEAVRRLLDLLSKWQSGG